MATARYILALCLIAASCALLIASNDARAHSTLPSDSSSTSLAKSSRTFFAAQELISSFVMALSFAR